MKLRTIASLSVFAVAATLGGIVVAPADAAAKTTLSIHVQSPAKKPLKDVEVVASRGDDTYVSFGYTDAHGNVTRSAGKDGKKLSAGEWTLHLHDLNVKRHQQGKEFAPRFFGINVAGGKDTSLGKRTLAAGAHVRGTITAPSGRKLQNVEVAVTPQPHGQGGGFLDFSVSNAKGVYATDGLAVGTAYFSTSATSQASQDRKVVVKKAGATYTGVDLTDVLVPCQGRLKATSSKPGQVTLTASTDTSFYGIANPRGSVELYRGTTLLDTISFKKIHRATKTYEDQPTGRTKYTVKYTGGDCESWSWSASTTIKAAPAS